MTEKEHDFDDLALQRWGDESPAFLISVVFQKNDQRKLRIDYLRKEIIVSLERRIDELKRKESLS